MKVTRKLIRRWVTKPGELVVVPPEKPKPKS